MIWIMKLALWLSSLSAPWLIEPRAAENHLPLAAAILSRDADAINAWHQLNPHQKNQEEGPSAVAFTGEHGVFPAWRDTKQAEPGSIAIHIIEGSIMKYDSSFDYGIETLQHHFRQAEENDNIAGHFFKFYTPGGSTAGLKDFADEIKASKKPTVGFAEDMCCSAGYWLLSSCDHTFANNTTCVLGSIGTLQSLRDYSEYFAQQGIKHITVTATKSTDKTKITDEAVKGNFGPLRERLLDPLNEVFHTAVKENRPGISDKVFTADVFVGEIAMEHGLVDTIGTQSQAIQKLREMISEGKNNDQQTQHQFKLKIG